jgi:hypothetical protein
VGRLGERLPAGETAFAVFLSERVRFTVGFDRIYRDACDSGDPFIAESGSLKFSDLLLFIFCHGVSLISGDIPTIPMETGTPFRKKRAKK